MLRLLILGATGSLGRHVLGQAFAAGHEVTVFFTSASSTTASIRRSAETRSSTAATRPITSSGSGPPFSASLPRLVAIAPSARSTAPGTSSWSDTRRPEAATT